MELRVRDERAVLAGGENGREADPHDIALGTDLADALHEWARVAAAVRRTGDATTAEAASMVSRRGRQLAVRVAAVLGLPVSYRDPVKGTSVEVQPPTRPPRRSPASRLFGAEPRTDTPTPWGTGLTVAAFIGAVVVVAMLALADTLAQETARWVALAAIAVVTAGLAPSLWLARRLPILRWVVLGAAAGVAVAWIGVLVIVTA
ncbi:DUF2537 domain-containing protein [Qaidamihabitans albus]|uniref:DUF2537 domain-containing protein n=1 Tax=Qaidamihabitans albus TaxID=2795733 RepID=UPI0018F1FBBD|nr:DUF2537 domain-containing protein [Qaidamihabitans albus]